MSQQSVIPRIFFFCELLIVLRLMFFYIPMLMDGASQGQSFSIDGAYQNHLYIVVLALAYLAAAVLGVIRHRFWEEVHLMAAALCLAFAVHLYQSNFGTSYLIALVWAVATAGIVFYYRESIFLIQKD